MTPGSFCTSRGVPVAKWQAIFEGLDLPGLVRIDGRRSEDAIAAEVLAVVLGQLDGLHEAMS